MTEGTVYSILVICGISHFLNDMIQSIIPSIYPIIKDKFGFSFAQIGIITLIFQMTSSILQPFTGLYADRHPRPYALSTGMCFTLTGLLLLAFAENYLLILLAVSIVGLGSSIFHPTASRVAQMASGGRKSLAQSIFQVGGNGGSALGPLLAAIIVLPFGQHSISWFALAALLAALIMVRLGAWYKARLAYIAVHKQRNPTLNNDISKRAKYWALFILKILLHIVHYELLHILPHRQVRRIGADIATLSVRVSCRLCHRNGCRRNAGRQVRPQIRHLVLHSRSRSIRAGNALCQPRMDHYIHIPVRTDHRFGILVDCSVRHRPHARQSWTDSRNLLRSDVWSGRTRIGLLRMACRQNQHRIHIPRERSAASIGHNSRFPAEYAEKEMTLIFIVFSNFEKTINKRIFARK